MKLENFLMKKANTPLISVILVLLVTSVIILTSTFNDYKLKTNLTAFQKREMKSSVENFIVIIDTIRNNIIENYERKNIEYDEEDVKEGTLSFIRNIVHQSNFSSGAYIWINEVVDFEGGPNYGIRQVHGNLPETEGMSLSTSMQDAKGNYPYLTELEGIKEHGEYYYNYWFKEYKSDKISEKITYAKLYEPYNWIVCTGTYLNAMYEPTGGVSKTKRLHFYIIMTIALLISIMLFVYMIVSNHSHSKKLIQETEILKGEVDHDALTGAGSRAYGNKLLQKYFNRFLSVGKNYSLAILDIDNFKSINDRYGHNNGDAVIKDLVNTIQALQTQEDHIIRWGGDEFILTYKHHENDLEAVLKELNDTVASRSVFTENKIQLHYTISIGASHFSSKDKNLADVIKRIDDALYLAKRSKNSYYIIES